MAESEIDRTNAARAKQLSTLDNLAQKFGDSLSKAFTSTVGPARQLDGALTSLVSKLAGMAGKAVLDPVKGGIESLVKSLINSGASSAAFAKGTARLRLGLENGEAIGVLETDVVAVGNARVQLAPFIAVARSAFPESETQLTASRFSLTFRI